MGFIGRRLRREMERRSRKGSKRGGRGVCWARCCKQDCGGTISWAKEYRSLVARVIDKDKKGE